MFESAQTSIIYRLASHRFDVHVEKVSNLFEPLVEQPYRVASHGYDVWRKFGICFESIVHQHFKVVENEFNVFRKL